MAQTYTSAGTSINSRHLPAVYGKTRFTAPFVLDIGCGRYTEHIEEALRLQGRGFLPYDPYNQPDAVTNETLYRLMVCIRSGIPVDVVCSNVLNVIDDEATIWDTTGWIQRIVQATGGTAYITVYEGDRSGIGRQTGPDQYQRNTKLRDYLRFFPEAVIRNGRIVVT